jgi:hypothetical protein
MKTPLTEVLAALAAVVLAVFLISLCLWGIIEIWSHIL